MQKEMQESAAFSWGGIKEIQKNVKQCHFLQHFPSLAKLLEE
jgi:hypothetical protein